MSTSDIGYSLSGSPSELTSVQPHETETQMATSSYATGELGGLEDRDNEADRSAAYERERAALAATLDKLSVESAPLFPNALSRLRDVVSHAVAAFDSPAQAEEWLWSDNPSLGRQPPILLARTEDGARQIHDVLGRFEHGVFG